MFEYTENTTLPLLINTAVSLNGEGDLTNQGENPAHGICVSSTLNTETNEYENVIYVAGGPGVQVKLGAEWDGKLTRFTLVGGYALPTSSKGQGWIVPENLNEPKNQDDLVQVVLYNL